MENETSNSCKAVLTDKIINCLKLNREKCDFFTNLDFILNDIEEEYVNNAPICVERVYVSYDNIGVVNDEINASSCGQNISLFPVYSIPVLSTNSSNIDTIYNQYEGIVKPECICNGTCEYYESKIYEQNLQFFVDNLVITIIGTIGCKPFSATYSYSGILSGLGFI